MGGNGRYKPLPQPLIINRPSQPPPKSQFPTPKQEQLTDGDDKDGGCWCAGGAVLGGGGVNLACFFEDGLGVNGRLPRRLFNSCYLVSIMIARRHDAQNETLPAHYPTVDDDKSDNDTQSQG